MALFGGYSEVAAYSQAPEIFFEEDDVEMIAELPPHLAPHVRVPHPWLTNASFKEDFILISEFSEQEGPKPLITIPTDAAGSFDLNAFAVKIMAVDFQMVGGAQFSVASDTQIVVEEDKERAYAYVHHFTLYDTEARGFVRPFCMAYVSPDKRKIMNNFADFLKEFRKVSTYFKYGNRLQFLKDIEHGILDLHYTKEKFIQYKKGVKLEDECQQSEAYEFFTYTTEDNFNHQIEELTNIMNAMKPLMTNRKLEERFKRLEEKSRLGRLQQTKPLSKTSLHEEGYHSDSSDIPSPTKLRKNFTPPCSFHNDDVYKPKLVKMDSYRRFDQALRTLHQLCEWGAKEGLNRLRKIHRCHSRDPVIVRFEGRESQLIEPPSTLLTIGRSVTINFLHRIDLDANASSCWPLYEVYKTRLRGDSVSGYSSYSDRRLITENKRNTDQSENMSLSSLETVDSFVSYSDETTDRDPRSSYDAAFVLGSAFVSLESLYYDVEESPYSDSSDSEYDVITDSSESNSAIGSSQQNTTDSMTNLLDIDHSTSLPKSAGVEAFLSAGSINSTEDSYEDSLLKPSNGLIGHHDTPTDWSAHVHGKMTVAPYGYHSERSSVSSPSSGNSTTLFDGAMNSKAKTGTLILVTEDSAPLTHEQPSEKYPRVPVGSCADHICRFHSNLPGAGILKFVQHYVFAAHIIYALLCGRPVVILGSQKYEKEVRSLITTLWLFVPGHSSRYHVVVPWRTNPLSLADLGKIKLVGLCKPRSPRSPNVLPSSVRKYVSILDYDKSSLHSPPYKGNFINGIVSRKKQFKSDQVFIAYIHSILLELASKAYLYYHSFCLNSTDGKSLQSSSSSPTNNHKTSVSGFLGKLGVTDGDAKIVEYWVELVKQQQVDDFMARVKGYASHDQLPPPPIRIDYKQCQEYRV
ncbi:guanine nucleotide exchange protein smcr8a-like isoform X2 [Ptychodera flava]|uniref:guanine nucleotide exchange protein smcr8a-like isoform X2 n=1 Tax=Ptychodera flava TaxID=63121 RepID=UPI003969DECA